MTDEDRLVALRADLARIRQKIKLPLGHVQLGPLVMREHDLSNRVEQLERKLREAN